MSMTEILSAISYVGAGNYGEPYNKYGFIEIENPNYMNDYGNNDDGVDYTSKYLLRKPTFTERKEIIVNTIIEGNGRSFSIPKLAKLLAVSDRTIQNCLRQLEAEGIIEISPRYGKNGVQKSNSYRYIGEPCDFYGNGLTLKTLYNSHENYGFRDWAWKNTAFPYDGYWYSLYEQCLKKFRTHVKKREYLEKHGLPLVIPEPIKYLALRYTYWKGKLWINEDNRITRDSTVKIELNTGRQYQIVRLDGYRLLLLFLGNSDNPKIKIYDLKYGKKLATFTWFSENIIETDRRINDTDMEQLILLGDFTTKNKIKAKKNNLRLFSCNDGEILH